MSLERVITHHSKSFSLAAKLLGPAQRADAVALYAWCRHADDAVDEGTDPARALVALRGQVDAMYSDAPIDDPVAQATREVIVRRAIPRLCFDEMLLGFEMDAQRVRYETLEELRVYCFRVAGTVGLMMAHVLGATEPRQVARAVELGIAMQLTNVCRDVAEDWGRGRLYVPYELLHHHGLVRRPEPGAHGLESLGAPLRGAVRELLDEASLLYASSDRGIAGLPRRSALAIRVARLVYSAIGDVIAARSYDVLRGRAFVPTLKKLVLVLRALAEGARRPHVLRV